MVTQQYFLDMLMTRLQPRKTPIGYMKAQGSTQQNFIRGGLHSEVQPLTLLYAVFDRKSYLFLIPSIDKWYLFYDNENE